MHSVMLRPITAISVLLLSFPIAADDISDTVALTYVALPDVSASVEFSGERISIREDVETVQFTMSGSIETQSSTHPDGILVRTNQTDVSFDSDNPEFREFMAPMMESLSSVELSSVISESGEMLTLEGMDSVLAVTKTQTRSIIDKMPDKLKTGMHALVDATLNKDAFLRRIQDDWDLEVGQWNGLEFEKGSTYEVEYGEAVQEFGNVELGFDGEFEYLGRVACNVDDDALSCAELSFKSSLKEEYAEHLTNAIATNLNLPLPDDFLMTVDTEVTLITEPSTLHPHQILKVKTISGPSDDGTGWNANIHTTRSAYTYH